MDEKDYLYHVNYKLYTFGYWMSCLFTYIMMVNYVGIETVAARAACIFIYVGNCMIMGTMLYQMFLKETTNDQH